MSEVPLDARGSKRHWSPGHGVGIPDQPGRFRFWLRYPQDHHRRSGNFGLNNSRDMYQGQYQVALIAEHCRLVSDSGQRYKTLPGLDIHPQG